MCQRVKIYTKFNFRMENRVNSLPILRVIPVHCTSLLIPVAGDKS